MIYLDTSCLLKLLREEPGSAAVRSTVATEAEVVVSSLTELETEVQLKAAVLGGDLRASQWRQYQAKLAALRNVDPFTFATCRQRSSRPLSGSIAILKPPTAVSSTGSIWPRWKNSDSGDSSPWM
jgi:uncharacterized protein with PIN domain